MFSRTIQRRTRSCAVGHCNCHLFYETFAASTLHTVRGSREKRLWPNEILSWQLPWRTGKTIQWICRSFTVTFCTCPINPTNPTPVYSHNYHVTICWYILAYVPNIKFHENPFSVPRVGTCGEMDKAKRRISCNFSFQMGKKNRKVWELKENSHCSSSMFLEWGNGARRHSRSISVSLRGHLSSGHRLINTGRSPEGKNYWYKYLDSRQREKPLHRTICR